MSAFLWWRSWHGAPMDSKWPVIAARAGVKVATVSAIVWALFDYASQHKIRGTVTGFDAEVYAVYSGLPEAEINAVIQVLTDKRVIVDGRLANWEKRQPQREDDSTARVRKHRELKRNVTQCNAEGEDVTFDSSLLSSLSVSESVSDSWVKEEEEEQFIKLRKVIETATGLQGSGVNAIKAIDNLIANGCTEQDILDGIQWRKDEGKSITSYAHVVGPANTARLKRIQGNGNGHAKSNKPFEVGPGGRVNL